MACFYLYHMILFHVFSCIWTVINKTESGKKKKKGLQVQDHWVPPSQLLRPEATLPAAPDLKAILSSLCSQAPTCFNRSHKPPSRDAFDKCLVNMSVSTLWARVSGPLPALAPPSLFSCPPSYLLRSWAPLRPVFFFTSFFTYASNCSCGFAVLSVLGRTSSSPSVLGRLGFGPCSDGLRGLGAPLPCKCKWDLYSTGSHKICSFVRLSLRPGFEMLLRVLGAWSHFHSL